MNSIILDALDYMCSIKQISPEDEMKFTDKFHNLLPVVYIKENDKFVKKVFNIIGFISYDLEEFIWAWSTNIYKYLHVKTNQLILHGINIEPTTMNDFYIKKILTTSNINMTNNDKIGDIIIALGCYLTKAHGYFLRRSVHAHARNIDTFYVFYDIKDVENLDIKPDL